MKYSLIFIYLLSFLSFIQSTQIWLPEVEGYSDYAGLIGKAITSLRVSGNLEYRVHTLGGSWLPPVTGNNQNDPNNGYAGLDNVPIDGVAIKGTKYKVHILGGGWLSEVSQYNINDLNYGMAGNLGQKIDAIMIKDRTYAVAYVNDVTPTPGVYSRTAAVAYARKYAYGINHSCNSDYLSCTPASYFGNEHCGYSGAGGDCANFVSQCLVLGGGHPKLNGGTDFCRGYPCGFEEPGARKLGQCLSSRGWTSSCGYLMAPPSNIKAGDVLIYHAGSCTDFDAHAVFVTQGGSNAKIACHSNEQLDVSYTYMSNSKPYYEWLHFND
jgi:hypothetical protein